jgi:uncharacterized membrane protein YeiH
MNELLLVLDLAGTFVFAISGAMLGVQRRLDVFGVLFLSFAASCAGGIARDVLIGSVPPAAIADWRYLAAAVVAGSLTFVSHWRMARLHTAIVVLDAGGLALFAVAGAQKAVAFEIDPVMAALLGMLTGIGGGVARDLLVARTPPVLERGLYALPALVAAVLVVLGHGQDWPIVPTAVTAAVVCFAIRLLAVRRGWNLPVAQR